MSTEINVTIGPQSLVDRSRQEVEANRFRRSEQDAQQRTQAAAEQARQAALAQQGVTPDGASQYGNPRRPEFLRQKPAAFRFDQGLGFVLPTQAAYVDGALQVLARGTRPMLFSKFDSYLTGDSGTQLSNFSVVPGPASQTFALAALEGEIVIGYTYTSDFAGSTIVDLRKVSDSINANTDFIGFAVASPLPSGASYVPLPALQNPSAASSALDSFTVEFIYQVAERFLEVTFNNTTITVGRGVGIGGDVSYIQVLTYGVTGTSWPSGFDANIQGLYADPLLPGLSLGQWCHVAMVKNAGVITVYHDGVSLFTATAAENYWDRYAISSSPVAGGQQYYLKVGELPFILKAKAFPLESRTPVAVHGIRFTPRALYTTTTFEPPTTITTLT